MRNPCTRCLELDFCQEGKCGEPCMRRRKFEDKLSLIRQEIEKKFNLQKTKKGGDRVAGDKGKGQT